MDIERRVIHEDIGKITFHFINKYKKGKYLETGDKHVLVTDYDLI